MRDQEILEEEKEYQAFEQSMQTEFLQLLKNKEPLFKAAVEEDLWENYLAGIHSDKRQYYNCSCCKTFIRKYGDLVILLPNGKLQSALWHPDAAPASFKKTVKQLKKMVEASSIKTVFTSDQRQLGTPVSGYRNHLSVTLPKTYINKSVLKTANQLMAEKKEDFKLLEAALNEYTKESVSTVKAIILSQTLYRSERFIGMITWFSEAQAAILGEKDSSRKKYLIWLYVAKAKVGYCHIKNSMLGTLLDDCQAGVDMEELIQRYNSKMNPSQYMRTESAPTQESLYEAERLVEKLGIADSLARRYARLEEIPEFIWRPAKVKEEKKEKGIFSEIIPKMKRTKKIELPIETMTWKKFSESILPNVVKLEAKVEDTSRFMGLITENIPHSEKIFQWNNPFSWYYHGGVDGEIKRRVQAAGGRYEENDIRCSLIWENRTDLDLHCLTPTGEHIFYQQKRAANGWLDVDMNVRGETMYPVENIRWTEGEGVEGEYHFYVHNYRDRSAGLSTPYKVELEIAGEVYTYRGTLDRTGSQETVFKFVYKKGKPIKLRTKNQHGNKNDWNLMDGQFAQVTGITKSPNLWGDTSFEHNGNHTFFLLQDCYDKTEGKGRGFFNEMLIPELREIRKTLEAYTASTSILEAEQATACGLGFTKDRNWDLTLRVTTDGIYRLIKIDRYD